MTITKPKAGAKKPGTRVSFRQRVDHLPRSAKIGLMALAALFFYALPLLEVPFISTPDTDFGGVLFIVSVYVLVALGLNIVVGYAGLLDLGYVAFFAVGAYAMALFLSLIHI